MQQAPKIGSTLFFTIIKKKKKKKKKKKSKRLKIRLRMHERALNSKHPLSGPWTPTQSEFGSALVMCVMAHDLVEIWMLVCVTVNVHVYIH